jgi:hypothetical protein
MVEIKGITGIQKRRERPLKSILHEKRVAESINNV